MHLGSFSFSPILRTPAHSRKLDACLKSSKDWARLSDHAERLLALQQLYAQIAPTYLAEGCAGASQVANYKSGKIVIHAANGAVAAKIRQLEPSLRSEFSKIVPEVTQITVRVQAGDSAPQYPNSSLSRRLPPEAAAGLEALAATLPVDSPLGAALRNLLGRSCR